MGRATLQMSWIVYFVCIFGWLHWIAGQVEAVYSMPNGELYYIIILSVSFPGKRVEF